MPKQQGTHCPQGHPYDEANTYVNPRGVKCCRRCRDASRRGEPIRPERGAAILRARATLAANGDRIVEKYQAGALMWDLAREYGVSGSTISQFLKRRGVPPIKGPRKLKFGSENHAWKGGTYVKDGYRHVKLSRDDPLVGMTHAKSHYVPEHRLVMARALGRPLESYETVHHIDGDGLNNHLSNLQLRIGRHGKGSSWECLDCGSQNVTAVPIGGRTNGNQVGSCGSVDDGG